MVVELFVVYNSEAERPKSGGNEIVNLKIR